MPRLRQVPKAEADDDIQAMYARLFGDRDPVAEPGTATGTPGNWWTVYALVPDIFKHAQAGFGVFSSRRRKLEPRYRELGLTRAGYLGESQFVFSQHCKAARAAGLTDAEVEALPAWQTSSEFDDKARAVLAYTDCLTLGRGRVPDGVFAALKEHFSDEEILEMTYATTTYALHATITRALRLEYDDVDDRIVEIPVPEEAGATVDVMRDISRADSE
jgi:alkylhydroperoxidase family enzyme